VAADLRDMPYGGYETYDFDVPVRDEADCYALHHRLDEMRQSMRIVEQRLERLEEPVR
jgi:NADH-quinone oxidoreductase subunit D